MEDLFPVLLLTTTMFVTKFIIDAFEGVSLPRWGKIALSLAISGGFVGAYRIDVLASQLDRDPSIGGYAVTALILAAVTSKLVHPVVDALRANGRETDSKSGA